MTIDNFILINTIIKYQYRLVILTLHDQSGSAFYFQAYRLIIH